MGQPVDFIPTIQKNLPDLYFIATADEYDKLIINPEYKNINVQEVLNFPNNKPGFYVITLQTANNIEEILANEHKKNQLPVEDNVSINGIPSRVLHSPLGSGRLEDVFDNNPDTLARVLEANPFLFDIFPASPIDTNSIGIQTGSLTTFTVSVNLYAPDSSEPIKYIKTFTNLPPDPKIEMIFDKGPAKSGHVTIEIHDDTSGETSQIHVRTIELK